MSEISQGMGRKNAEMGKAHFSVLRMGKVRRLLKVSFFHANYYERIIRMLFFLALRTFVYSLPDTFNTLSATVTIVKHLRVFFLRDKILSQVWEGNSIEKLRKS